MNHEERIALRKLLVALYDEPLTIRRVAEDAGLDLSRMALGGSALDCWHAVLGEAEKVGRVEQLILVARSDYPNRHTELTRFLLAIDQELAESTSDGPEEEEGQEDEFAIQAWQHRMGDGIASVAVAGDGSTIVVGTLGKKAICLDGKGRKRWEQTVGNQAWRVDISRNGQLIAVGTGSTRPWDMGGRELCAFDADGALRWRVDLMASIWGLAVSANGRSVAAGTSNKQLLFYDARGHPLWRENVSGVGWWAWVWCAALSANGAIVAAGAADRRVRILDRAGNRLADYGTRGDVFSVAVSADGAQIVAGDNAGYIYWLNQQGQLRWEKQLAAKVWALRLTHNGQRLLVGASQDEEHLALYDSDGRQLWRRTVEDKDVTSVALSSDGQRMAAGTRRGGIHIFDGEGQVVHKARAAQVVRDVAISDDGALVVAGSEDGVLYGFHLPPNNATTRAAPVADSSSEFVHIEILRNLRLNDVEHTLLRQLFSASDAVRAAKVSVGREFGDGLTAARVLLVRPTGADGVEELPVVVKMGPRALIEQEWLATQQHVLRRLPGFTQVQGRAVNVAAPDGAQWGALRYAQVGDGVFDVESLGQYVRHAALADLWYVLENRLLRQLGVFWRATASWETVRLQHSYDAILPVNLVVEPVASAVSGAQVEAVLLDARSMAQGEAAPIVGQNDLVRLHHFVVTEVSEAGREITLNLPTTARARVAAYRLRLHLPQMDERLQPGATLPSTLCRVRETRFTLLLANALSQLDEEAQNGDEAAPTEWAAQLRQPHLSLPAQANVTLPNPLLLLPALLGRTFELRVATIHGDLNLRNVLIDPEARTVHFIDCAAARRDHVLHDLLRLERDIVVELLAQTFFQSNMPPSTIYTLYLYVHCATQGEPHDVGQFAIPKALNPALHRAYVLLLTIRQAARDYLGRAGGWDEYYTGLVVHLLGALKFKDLDRPRTGQKPKAIAFWGAATIGWLLEELTTESHVPYQNIQWEFLDLTAASSH